MEDAQLKLKKLIGSLYNKFADLSEYKVVVEEDINYEPGLNFTFDISPVSVRSNSENSWIEAWSSILSSFDKGVKKHKNDVVDKRYLSIKDICVWIEWIEDLQNDFCGDAFTRHVLNVHVCIRCYDPLKSWYTPAANFINRGAK